MQTSLSQSTDHSRLCRRAYAATAVLLCAVALVVAFFLGGCSSSGQADSSSRTVPSNGYDYARITDTGGVKSYRGADGKTAAEGIDVSSHNQQIDWQAVAASGVDFAYLRAGYRGYTEGKIWEDELFDQNIEGATKAGLDVGVYFFSQAITEREAREEADWVLEAVKGYQLRYPIAFDLEENGVEDERIAGLTQAETTQIAKAFCDRIRERGYEAIIYGNNLWLDGHYDLAALIDTYDLWYADYADKPGQTYRFRIWQYTSTGDVPGISGSVDRNLCFY
ncbi:MAG: glycoside hydrolase family 25 protein, partial [Raoultibacter sp.]